ncbi:hypothetical protein HY030_01680 [Candidatus Gottesmanbacteria bacterium]|nr:hypothetical protein [Candidatus Gottesmanbacteria bacterium]
MIDNQKATKIRHQEEQDFLYDVKRITSSGLEKNADVKKIKPLYHASDLVCKLREDEITKPLTSEEIFQNAKLKTKDYFVSINPITNYEK